MITLITVVILLACAVLAFCILVQNPKGGGLSGSFGSMSSQIMGVKQSGDVMEKSTWYAMGLIGALCIMCVMFFPKQPKMREATKQPTQQSAPATAPASPKAPTGK